MSLIPVSTLIPIDPELNSINIMNSVTYDDLTPEATMLFDMEGPGKLDSKIFYENESKDNSVIIAGLEKTLVFKYFYCMTSDGQPKYVLQYGTFQLIGLILACKMAYDLKTIIPNSAIILETLDEPSIQSFELFEKFVLANQSKYKTFVEKILQKTKARQEKDLLRTNLSIENDLEVLKNLKDLEDKIKVKKELNESKMTIEYSEEPLDHENGMANTFNSTPRLRPTKTTDSENFDAALFEIDQHVQEIKHSNTFGVPYSEIQLSDVASDPLFNAVLSKHRFKFWKLTQIKFINWVIFGIMVSLSTEIIIPLHYFRIIPIILAILIFARIIRLTTLETNELLKDYSNKEINPLIMDIFEFKNPTVPFNTFTWQFVFANYCAENHVKVSPLDQAFAILYLNDAAKKSKTLYAKLKFDETRDEMYATVFNFIDAHFDTMTEQSNKIYESASERLALKTAAKESLSKLYAEELSEISKDSQSNESKINL